MPARSQKPPTDVTGRQAEILAEQFAAESEAAASRMSVITAQKIAQDSEEVQWDGPKKAPAPTVNPNFALDEVEVGDVEVATPMVKFRVNTDLEDVTIGAGNNYTFLRDKVYNYPRHIYEHLNEKGYVYH